MGDSVDPDRWLQRLRADDEAETDIASDPWLPELREHLHARERHLAEDDAGLVSLQQRLAEEGLLDEPTKRTAHLPVRPWMGFAVAASVIAAVGVGAVLSLFDPVTSEHDAMRFRGAGEWVTITVANPDAWVANTRAAMDAADCLHGQIGDADPVLVVDARPDCLEPLNARLQETGTQLAEPGRYRIRVLDEE